MGHVIGIDTTYTGNPVSFNAAHGGTMKSVVVPFSPTQDLHGYATPWPGGGGKNKAPVTTFSVKHDTVMKFSPNLPAGTYSYSYVATRTGESSANGAIRFVYDDDTYLQEYLFISTTRQNKNGAVFTKPVKSIYVYSISGSYGESSNYTITCADFQLELGSTASSWQPYSNICPISGRTGLSVYRTGKNLFDEAWEIGAISTTTGETVSSNTSIRTANYIPLVGGQSYYWSWQSQQSLYMLLFTYHADKTFSRYAGAVTAQREITINSDEAFIRFYIYNNTTEPDWMQISEGSTASQYEPYNGNTYAVDWSTQAGTVYHGTVDPVAGQLTVDWASVDMGTLSWTAYGGSATRDRYITSGLDSLAKNSSSVLCSIFRPRIGSETIVANMAWIASGNSKTSATTEVGAYANASAFKTGMSGQQLVYELATPLTYQLTPKQIEALIGQNYIWSSNNETLTAVLTAPATGFAGWLIKCVTNGTPVEIPLKYMRAETYTVTPDQRMEWSAERDVTGVLHRETVQNLPPKIEFNTPLMTNSDINALNSIINAAFTNYLQRNITIQFYDPERNEYWEWDCYMPDVKYHIRNADTVNNIINYEELRYAFIGY